MNPVLRSCKTSDYESPVRWLLYCGYEERIVVLLIANLLLFIHLAINNLELATSSFVFDVELFLSIEI